MKRQKLILNFAIAIILIGFIIYQSIDLIQLNKKKQHQNWTQDQIDEIVEKCINDAYQVTDLKIYPEIIRNYCECATDTLIKHFKYDELLEQENLTLDEKMKVNLPIVQKCMDKALTEINEN